VARRQRERKGTPAEGEGQRSSGGRRAAPAEVKRRSRAGQLGRLGDKMKKEMSGRMQHNTVGRGSVLSVRERRRGNTGSALGRNSDSKVGRQPERILMSPRGG
jgi:hypothetical protein